MPIGPDGDLVPYTPEEIEAWELGTRGIDEGTNPEEFYSPDGSGCTRPWFCVWDKRFEVINHLVGDVTIWDDSGTNKVSRLMPQTHPDHPTWACVEVRVVRGHKFVEDDDDAGPGNLIPTYTHAELEAKYRQVPYKLLPDSGLIASEIERYVTEPGYPGADVTTGAQYTTMPGGIMKFKTDDGSPPHNVPVPHPIGYTDCEGKFSVIWRRVPKNGFDPDSPLFKRVFGDPTTGSRPWIGSTNVAVLFGRDIGTCLLEGCEPKLLPDPTGVGYSWDIKFDWFYKPQTHYKLRFWGTKPSDPDNGLYQVAKPDAPYTAVEDLGDDDSLFPLRDHADGLFKVS